MTSTGRRWQEAGLRWLRRVGLAGAIVIATAVAAGANAITDENALPGNPPGEWDITGIGDATIQGFATDISVNRGGTITFKIKTDAASYHIDIYRLGYYQGNGARHVGIGVVTATLPQIQPNDLYDSSTGLTDCGNWAESAHWDVPGTAVSGIYIARLTRDDTQGASHIVFVVRNDASTSDLFFQTSDATWQAYNGYGGNSLYVGTTSFPGGHAAKVSYNRPFFTRGGGGGSQSSEDWLFNSEYPMVRFLESNGYDVTYTTDIDTKRSGNRILNHKVFLSVGHDEYWSAEQRASVQAARDAGVHIAFFGGNEIYWKTRWETSTDGTSTPDRTLVCYKEGTLGEVACGSKCDPTPTWTGLWRDGCPPTYTANDGCLPENALSGNISWDGTTGAIQVSDTYKGLRFWRNTRVASLGIGQSTTLGTGTLGYEWDWQQYTSSYPAGRILMSTTVLDNRTHHLSLYRSPSGALVFSAGTIQWAWGLDSNHDRGNDAPDVAIQQATVNLFADMGSQPASLQGGLTAATASSDHSAPSSAIVSPLPGANLPSGNAVTITGTASDAGGGVVAGIEVSTDGGLTWTQATGTTSWSFVWTPTTQGPVTIESRGVDDSGNLEVPGGGETPANVITVNVTAPAPPTCPCTLFLPTDTPINPAANDGPALENGVRFTASVDGFITGFRYYKGAGTSGTRIAHLWTNTGGQLAEVTFTGESGSGWQQVNLPTPVAITAGTTYVASVFSGAGFYAFTNSYFTQALVHGPLRAPADGENGDHNGLYLYTPTSAFPVNSFQASNYWVDVVFNTSSGPDVTPPTVVSVSPGVGAGGVATTTQVTATFDEPIDPATVTSSTMRLTGPGATTVTGTVNYDPGSQTARFVPDAPLAYSTAYTATLKGGATDPRIKDVAGNALAADFIWSFTTGTPPPPPADEGPGGPILVISAASNPFSRYYAEILRAEGLNEFTATDISLVTPSVLSTRDVVILGQMTLTAGQVTMLSDWVNAGGTLVAMRPDPQLATLLGLGSAGGTLSNAYLLVNTASGPGAGIVGQTMQFHGAADQWTLNGATALATLYSGVNTSTSYPAVTTRLVGSNGGSAVAFTFDLARSVIYTRQGNPAWAGQKRDGQIPPNRSDDMFFGNASYDPEPDWIDFSRIAIPQADEQQRLLANVILQGNLHRKPLPRFWYLPRGLKAAIVMTGDDHASGGTIGRFNQYLTDSPSNTAQAVADWTAIRGTSYIYPGTPITNTQAAAFESQGFEISVHVNTNCANWTPASLDNFYTTQMAQLASQLPGISAPATHRTHCIAWSDWATQPQVELAHGIRLDCTYYYWPASWINDRPGLFTGSGMPMRFAQLDGTTIDCYQLATQMPDESGETFPAFVDSLIARALGPRGYYGVFCANMHTDNADSPGSDAIIASAQANQVPVISAKQMLTWLDGRNGSSFGSASWSGNQLSFSIAVGAGANNLQAMVPTTSAVGALTGITLGGSPVATTTQVVKGIQYAFFPAAAGNYVATYAVDTTPPVISAVNATPNGDGTATVTWTTDEAADSHVDYGTSSSSLTQTTGNNALVTSHTVTLTGLSSSTVYYYRVRSADAASNSATSPNPPAPPASFTTPAALCFLDALTADFLLGTTDTGTHVSTLTDGEVMLAPTLADEFGGSTLTSLWQAASWQGGGSDAVAGGIVSVNGFGVTSNATFGPGSSLEFVATFRGDPFQNIGFATGAGFNAPWVTIGTGGSGSGVFARSNSGSDVSLGAGLLGSPHRYRIDWGASDFTFWVDGVQVTTVAAVVGSAMNVELSDFNPNGLNVDVDWVHATPYASSGSFMSRIYDGGGPTNWLSASWTASLPTGTSLHMYQRQGPTAVPDGSWTAFIAIPGSGSALSGNSRYIQYRADLATTVASSTPLLEDMHITCQAGADVTPPVISAVTATPGADGATATITWTTDEPANSRVDYGLSPVTLTSNASNATFTTSHSIPLSGLSPLTTYFYRVTSADPSANSSSSPASPASFTTPAPTTTCASDDIGADFAAGTHSGTYVSLTGNGEVILAPTVGTEFTTLPPPAEWQSFPWAAGGTSTVVGGQLVSDGARFNTEPATGFGAGRSLEFVATFSAAPFQHVGFGGGNDTPPNDIFDTSPWAIFSTGSGGAAVMARTWDGGSFLDFTIPGNLLGTPHRYRIDWGTNQIDYSVDGALVHSEAVTIAGPMRPAITDVQVGGATLAVDWIRMSPYPASGTFTSRVFDAGAPKAWGVVSWDADLPTATSLGIDVRTGDVAVPDGTWSAWNTIASSGASVGATTRYVEYRARLATTDPTVTPALRDLSIQCTAVALSSVAAQAPSGGSCINNVTPCLSVPMVFTRNESATARALSVYVQLSSQLKLCDAITPANSVHLGSWANGFSAALNTVDHGGGLYQIDLSVLGNPCGPTTSGTLFTLDVTNAGADGSGTITVSQVTARDCANGTIAVQPGTPLALSIDRTNPSGISDLATAPVTSGNGTSGIIKLHVSFTVPGDASAVEVYRAPFGNYPDYDDGASPGHVPVAPVYPPPAPWTRVTGMATSGNDTPPSRDFWYYVAFTRDACGNAVASNLTSGALDYVLGDVHNGAAMCQGDNQVTISDISALGAHYGATLAVGDALECLDVGPTTDLAVTSRPTTDHVLDFEDLLPMAVNFGLPAGPQAARLKPANLTLTATDAIRIVAVPLPAVGEEYDVPIEMDGAGDVQGLSIKLSWDHERLEFVGVRPGALLNQQGGPSSVLSSRPGTVDVALLGRGTGIGGTGEIAIVRFKVLAPADPLLAIGTLLARDGRNHPLSLGSQVVHDRIVPAHTALGLVYPNPVREQMTVEFGLSRDANVRLSLFDLAGRRVARLVDAPMQAGEQRLTWDGRGNDGVRLASGFYVLRLEAGEVVQNRPLRIVR
jgi:Domain of unknown function (DUF4082)/Bacterial Ig-like domain/Bacterial Ig domain/Purple acid Phosphatase, N-terminal domain/FlgD Ig-like domain/Cohesin domain